MGCEEKHNIPYDWIVRRLEGQASRSLDEANWRAETAEEYEDVD